VKDMTVTQQFTKCHGVADANQQGKLKLYVSVERQVRSLMLIRTCSLPILSQTKQIMVITYLCHDVCRRIQHW
jgi:hypothetical protein